MYEPNLLPSDRDTRRRRGVIVALLAAGVVVVGLGGWWLLASALGSSPDATRPTSQTSPEGQARSQAPEPAAVTGTARLQLTPEGIISVMASYSFEEGVNQFWLSVPPPSDAARDQRFAPSISGLRVSVPGRQVREISGRLGFGSRINVPIPADATEVSFEYLVDGVVVSSVPSTAGRAAALLTPLDVRSATRTVTTLVVEDSGVIGLGCQVDDSPVTACGSETDSGWQVIVDSAMGDTRIVAAVDLPKP